MRKSEDTLWCKCISVY